MRSATWTSGIARGILASFDSIGVTATTDGGVGVVLDGVVLVVFMYAALGVRLVAVVVECIELEDVVLPCPAQNASPVLDQAVAWLSLC